MEKYISSLGGLHFKDSCQFLANSLAKLAEGNKEEGMVFTTEMESGMVKLLKKGCTRMSRSTD